MVCTRVQKVVFELSQEKTMLAWDYVVRYLYKMENDDFFSNCHKAGGTMEECIQNTLETFSDNAEFYTLSSPEGEIVGFFVKTMFAGKAVLEGFHISQMHRNAESIIEFWSHVNNIFGCTYYIGVLSSNAPAIKHLTRNGFVHIGTTENQGKMFNLLENKLI